MLLFTSEYCFVYLFKYRYEYMHIYLYICTILFIMCEPACVWFMYIYLFKVVKNIKIGLRIHMFIDYILCFNSKYWYNAKMSYTSYYCFGQKSQMFVILGGWDVHEFFFIENQKVSNI